MNRQASSGPRGGSEPGAAPAARSARRRALLLLALVGTHALAFFTGYSAHGANALRGVAAAAAAASSAAAGAGLEVVAARLGAGAAPAPGGAAQQQALGQDGQQATQHVKLTGAAAQSSVTAARAALRARLAARAAARGAAGSQQQISLRPAEVAAFSAAHPAVVEPAAAAAVAAAAPTPGRVADLGSGGDDGAWVGRFRPYASGGIVVYTWTNLSMKDFLMMFLLNLRRHGLTSFVIGAMDPELRTWLDQARRRAQCARACAALTARGRGVASLQEAPKLGMVIPVLTLNAGLTTGDFGWNSPSFKRMAKYKFQAVQQMMALGGWDVVVADTDTAWLRNPLPYFASKPEPDILTSTDVLRRMHIKDQLHSTLNIGVMVFRARPGCVDFVTAFYTEMVQDPGFGTANAEWDQSRFNRMVRDGMEIGPREREWALGWQGRVKVQALDIVDFPNGHVFFTQRLPQTLGVVPYIVHATFQYGGTPGKRHRFREQLAWGADPPAYFAPPGGLLAYDFTPDPAALAAANSSVEAHFELMNPQLEALRSAWALARALGRVLVLPRLTCGMDRVWFPHDGVFPGSDPAFTIPFSPCPMDHVLDAEGMEKRGLLAQVREWSLLNNPQLPPATLAAAVLVDWLPPGSEAAAAAGPGPRGETLLVPGWDAAAVAAALAPLKGAPLLRFGSMPPNAAVFQPGSSAGAQFWPEGDRRRADFVEDMRIIGSQWCCIDEAKAKLRNQPYPPGQVWYDLMVGVVPHTDRFNRLWDGPWKIRLGP